MTQSQLTFHEYINEFVNKQKPVCQCLGLLIFFLFFFIFLGCPEAIDLLGQLCRDWTVRKAVGKVGVAGPAGARTCYP